MKDVTEDTTEPMMETAGVGDKGGCGGDRWRMKEGSVEFEKVLYGLGPINCFRCRHHSWGGREASLGCVGSNVFV